MLLTHTNDHGKIALAQRVIFSSPPRGNLHTCPLEGVCQKTLLLKSRAGIDGESQISRPALSAQQPFTQTLQIRYQLLSLDGSFISYFICHICHILCQETLFFTSSESINLGLTNQAGPNSLQHQKQYDPPFSI